MTRSAQTELQKVHRLTFRAERDPDGSVRAIVSELGKIGRDGIVIKKGAVGEQNVVLSSWSHNSTSWSNPVPPVGRGMVKEDGDVLRMNGQVWLDDPEGKKAWRILDEMDWLEWSITFAALQRPDVKYNEETDDFMVVYSELRVFEASPVPIGGSYGTETEQLRQAARDSRSADLEVQRLKQEAEDKALAARIQDSADAILADQIFQGVPA